MKKLYILVEFFTLFVVLPLAILLFNLKNWFLPILWLFAAWCFLHLRKNQGFDRKILTGIRHDKKELYMILKIFSVSAAILTTYCYFFLNEKFFAFPTQRTALWAAVMVLYPILSAYPQEIIYRAFFFERYKNIFKINNTMILASASAFGFAHIILNNPVAIFLSFAGGIIFGLNYSKNKSLLLVSIEHALYGCMIFTIGMGYYFYHGAN